MRKENRVVLNYLKLIKNNINTLIEDVKKCEPNELHSMLHKAIMSNPEFERSADRIEEFVHKLVE